MRTVCPGWRYFKCPKCKTKWRESCRDYQTHSISDCPKCNEVASPYQAVQDPDILTDDYGNLKGGEKIELVTHTY
jgi:hypothetical protein